MNKGAVKDLMFGGLYELMRNRDYYYYSQVGQAYSYWTDDGKEAIHQYLSVMAWKLREAEEAELNQRAKDLVMKELKS